MTSITSSNPFNQSFAPWGTGEPNGDTMENCGILSVWWGGWNDNSAVREPGYLDNIYVDNIHLDFINLDNI